MKKFFTLCIAMAFVTMSFAQGLLVNTTTQVQLPASERSDWYGFNSTSGSVYVMAAESEYVLRIPQGDIPAGATLTQVRFYHTTSDHVTGYDGTFNNETYVIRIYTDVTYDAEHNNVILGTPVYTQNYTVPEGDEGIGINVATLNTPFTVPATGDVVIGIYAAEAAAVCLCPTDSTCADNNFALFADHAENGYHHWVFGSEYDEYGELIASHKPFLLSVYYDDGLPYQPKSDFICEIYDPEDQQTYPDAVTGFTVDTYTDSVFFYGGAFNYGVDQSIGFYTLSIYLDGATPFYFIDHEQLNTEEDTVDLYYGWRWDFGLFDMNEDVQDINDNGFNWPNEDLQLCMNLEYQSTDAYNGVDPNTENNTYCVTVHYDNGINENTNTLNVFPNPAGNQITVDNAAGAQISIYNIAGQEVMNIESANANEQINVSNLTEGIYVVRVVNGNEVFTSKVTIAR